MVRISSGLNLVSQNLVPLMNPKNKQNTLAVRMFVQFADDTDTHMSWVVPLPC